jgi:hypothetical protein
VPQKDLITRLQGVARHLLIGASFVNLSILPLWAAQANRYVEPLPYRKLLLMVLLLGLGVTAIARLLERYWQSSVLQGIGLAAFAVFPLQGALLGLGITLRSLRATTGLSTVAVVSIGALVAAVMFWRYRSFLSRAAVTALLLLSPLLGYSAYVAAQAPDPGPGTYRHYEAQRPDSSGPSHSLRPLVLVLMDEADYDLMFGDRPHGLVLPNFDELARTSTFFRQAYSSGLDTVLSIPAMFMGTPLRSVRASGLRLSVRTREGDAHEDWMTAPNLLRDLVESGARVAVVGFYHAYCDHPTLRFAYCSHWQWLAFRGWEFEIMPFPFAAFQDNHLIRRLAPPNLNAAKANADAAYRNMFTGTRAEMERYAGAYDFTFVHLIRPHPPGYPVSVVRRNHPTVTLDQYSERLREADAYLGELLTALRASYGDFALIVTADHGLRYASWSTMGYRFEGFGQRTARAPQETFRVPLLIHLSASAHGLQPDMPVSTLQLRSVIPGIMRREIDTGDDIVAQLARQPFDPGVLSLEQSFEKRGAP